MAEMTKKEYRKFMRIKSKFNRLFKMNDKEIEIARIIGGIIAEKYFDYNENDFGPGHVAENYIRKIGVLCIKVKRNVAYVYVQNPAFIIGMQGKLTEEIIKQISEVKHLNVRTVTIVECKECAQRYMLDQCDLTSQILSTKNDKE